MKLAREEILEKLRNIPVSLPEKPDFSEDVFAVADKNTERDFKTNFELVNGKVHVFSEEKELYENLKLFLQHFVKTKIISREPEIQNRLLKYSIDFSEELEPENESKVAVTGCEFIIARTGSIMMSSAQRGGRQVLVFPRVHIVIARRDQIVRTPDLAYTGILKRYGKNLPSQITLITGPSRTADIEKVLTLGAHGPKELHIFLQ